MQYLEATLWFSLYIAFAFAVVCKLAAAHHQRRAIAPSPVAQQPTATDDINPELDAIVADLAALLTIEPAQPELEPVATPEPTRPELTIVPSSPKTKRQERPKKSATPNVPALRKLCSQNRISWRNAHGPNKHLTGPEMLERLKVAGAIAS